MYYNIDKIRGVTFNRIPLEESEKIAAVKKFFTSENLIDLKIFSKIYTQNSLLYIDVESFQLFQNELYKRFRIKKKTAPYEKSTVTEVDACFFVNSLNDLRELELLRQEACVTKKKKKSNLIEAFNRPLPTNIADKKLMALDFEFVTIGDYFEPLEMGVSIQVNGQRMSYNYSFSNESKDRFNYGETSNIDKTAILDIFKEHFSDCDYLVGHNLCTEISILKQLGLEEEFIENMNFIDTSYVSKNEFHFLNSDHVKNETASLRTALRTFDIPYLRLHVAGNDAAYTLDVLNQMVFYKLNFQRKNEKQKIQVCNKFKG